MGWKLLLQLIPMVANLDRPQWEQFNENGFWATLLVALIMWVVLQIYYRFIYKVNNPQDLERMSVPWIIVLVIGLIIQVVPIILFFFRLDTFDGAILAWQILSYRILLSLLDFIIMYYILSFILLPKVVSGKVPPRPRKFW